MVRNALAQSCTISRGRRPERVSKPGSGIIVPEQSKPRAVFWAGDPALVRAGVTRIARVGVTPPPCLRWDCRDHSFWQSQGGQTIGAAWGTWAPDAPWAGAAAPVVGGAAVKPPLVAGGGAAGAGCVVGAIGAALGALVIGMVVTATVGAVAGAGGVVSGVAATGAGGGVAPAGVAGGGVAVTGVAVGGVGAVAVGGAAAWAIAGWPFAATTGGAAGGSTAAAAMTDKTTSGPSVVVKPMMLSCSPGSRFVGALSESWDRESHRQCRRLEFQVTA